MKIFCTASSDTYITDKIIDESFRAEDANLGQAGTLDLFKLYDEEKLNGVSDRNELSRILIKFDLTKARNLLSTKLDVNDPKFKAEIRLFDVRSGHAVPSNFTVIAHPLAKSFDEGQGRDVAGFQDLSVANFLTASLVNDTLTKWFVSGANYEGPLGEADIDIATYRTIDGSNVQLCGTQHFAQGDEDLKIDVTAAISGTLDGQVSDLGFRISFSGSYERDKKSRFVKRFASRHAANPHLRPRLEISFPDYIVDNRSNFYFDTNSTVFLKSSKKSELSNLIAGGSDVEGTDCLNLKIVKGSFSKVILASSHTEGSSKASQKGVYSASFSVSAEDSTEYERGKTLASLIAKEKEVTFDEYWYSLDGSKGFHTGSLTIKSPETEDSFLNDDIEIFATNCSTSYTKVDRERISLFGINRDKETKKAYKKPIKKKSEIFEKAYYRVLDANSLEVVIDFGEEDESTRVSVDKEGMYFDFYFDVLPFGRSYLFEYLVVHNKVRKVIRDKRTRFTVV